MQKQETYQKTYGAWIRGPMSVQDMLNKILDELPKEAKEALIVNLKVVFNSKRGDPNVFTAWKVTYRENRKEVGEITIVPNI